MSRQLSKSLGQKNKVYTEKVQKPLTQRETREKCIQPQSILRPPGGQSTMLSTLPQSQENTQNFINNNQIYGQTSDREDEAAQELFYTKDQLKGLNKIRNLDGLRKNELIQIVKMQQFKLDMQRKRIVQLEDQDFFENTAHVENATNPDLEEYVMENENDDCDKCDHGRLLREYKKKLREKEIQLRLYYKELNTQTRRHNMKVRAKFAIFM